MGEWDANRWFTFGAMAFIAAPMLFFALWLLGEGISVKLNAWSTSWREGDWVTRVLMVWGFVSFILIVTLGVLHHPSGGV